MTEKCELEHPDTGATCILPAGHAGRHRQGQPSHTCHIPYCQIEVPRKLLMCLKHWRMVPLNLQRMVWRYYQAGQEERKVSPTKEYLDAAAAAIRAAVEKERPLLEKTKGR